MTSPCVHTGVNFADGIRICPVSETLFLFNLNCICGISVTLYWGVCSAKKGSPVIRPLVLKGGVSCVEADAVSRFPLFEAVI